MKFLNKNLGTLSTKNHTIETGRSLSIASRSWLALPQLFSSNSIKPTE